MNRYPRLVAVMIFMCVVSSPGQVAQEKKQASNNGSTFSPPSLPFDSHQGKEDWTALSIDRSGLDPSLITGVVFGKSERPEFTSEVVRVQWRSGDPIDLYVVRPQGVAKPPVILFLYDYLSDTDRFRNEAWCREVVKHGFAAVGFVSALTGQRYHGRPMTEWFISEMQEALGASTHDVQMIINYLASRGDMDTTKVGMLGENSGGTIAVLAATADPRIAFVDAINPWGDWPDWLKESRVIPEDERADYLKPEFLQKVAMLDPVKYLPQLSPGRIRIEQVASDPMTPQDVQAKIAASASTPSVVVHYSDVRTQIHVWMTQNWWLKEKLQPSATPTTAEINHDKQSSGQ
jgi:dienelactone hydrolase